MGLKVLIYDIVIHIYFGIIWLLSPFHNKAKAFCNGRLLSWKQLSAIPKNQPIIWFHCASLGEFEQAKPVIEQLKINNPQCKILVSFFSPSGYQQVHKHKQTDFYFYLPKDSKINANKLLKIVSPKAVVFVKYDLWYHYIHAIHKHQIPLYLLSAKVHKGGRWNAWSKEFTIHILKKFSRIYCQDESSFKLLSMTNAKNLFEIGDTRIDRVLNIAKQIYKNETIEQFIGNSRCLIVGSSWEHEEAIIEKALPHLIEKNIKVIIAPHDINRANEIAKQYNNCILYTEANIKNTSNNFILILNTIGILSKVYRYGNYAIIGGGFSNKLHNIYEAAVYGIPVMYGPNNSKYPEAKTLVNAEIGFEIKNEQTLIEVVNNIKMGDIKQKSKLFYAQNSGIVERISHVLETDLK